MLHSTKYLSPGSPVVATAMCCAMGMTTAVMGAEAQRKGYNLPAGDAAATLKHFAANSGEQIVYLVDNVRGEKTNAVAGEFAAREALERMLAGTRLMVTQDQATGALVVGRKRPADPPAPAQSGPKPQALNPKSKVLEAPEEPPITMKPMNRVAILLAWLGFTLTTGYPAMSAEGTSASVSVQQTGSITGRVQNVALGRYLTNARVSVKGTGIVAFTDEFGAYRLTRVPIGPVGLEVFYTGLDPQQIALQMSAGQTLVQDVNLTSVTRYGQNTDPVKLAAFIVATSKETEGEALATNEQRFSPNIKSVVATDTFGDVQEGNLGEFIKFLPGVTVNYQDAEAMSVSVRGFSPNLTAITTDGAQTSNANYEGSSRAPFMSQMSINNISRVEVSKVPTPSSAADSLGGAVNMVSKSAFERSRAELRYRTYFSANSHRLKKIKDPYAQGDKETYKVLPNFDFDYTLPLGKNFGIVVTGMTSNFFNEQRIHQSAWSAAAAGTSFSQPFRLSDVIVDAPRYTHRNAFALNADWRFTPNSVVSVGFDISDFDAFGANVSRSALTGSNAVPTIAVANGGVPFSFGPDYTIGATGRGSVNLVNNSGDRYEKTTAGKLRYRFDNGDWRINASINRSRSSTKFRGDDPDSVFTALDATLDLPVRVAFSNIAPVLNGDSRTVVRAFFNDGREVDINDINNYRITTARMLIDRTIYDKVSSGDASIRRRIGLLPFPATLQIGSSQRVQERDSRRPLRTFTYNGVGGNRSAAPYQFQVYKNQNSGFGARNINFIDVSKAARAFKADPSLFSQTPAQVVAEATSIITTSEYIREAVSAFYAQTELQLLSNRLKILTGVRYEKTKSDGKGPVFDPGAVFARNANGTFARNPQGQRIRKAEAGAVGSIEELRLTRQERGNQASGSYDAYFPSLHLTYSVTENFLARAAYAETYGRPNFSEIIPNVVINERDLNAEQLDDPNEIPGTMTVRNPGLKPWLANNYDLSLEYYTDQGGMFSVGAFRKDIRDFFANDVRRSTAADTEQLGLDSRYIGYQMSTKINAGDARVTGAEFSLRHSLTPLGQWARHFTVFFNATKLKLEGNRQADFSGFVKDSRSGGVTLTRIPFTVMVKWNWRGEQKNTAFPGLGPDAFVYIGPRTHFDLNLDYQFRKRMSVFLNVRNVFNERHAQLRYGSATPAYANTFAKAEYGAQIGAGVKGTF